MWFQLNFTCPVTALNRRYPLENPTSDNLSFRQQEFADANRTESTIENRRDRRKVIDSCCLKFMAPLDGAASSSMDAVLPDVRADTPGACASFLSRARPRYLRWARISGRRAWPTQRGGKQRPKFSLQQTGKFRAASLIPRPYRPAGQQRAGAVRFAGNQS